METEAAAAAAACRSRSFQVNACRSECAHANNPLLFQTFTSAATLERLQVASFLLFGVDLLGTNPPRSARCCRPKDAAAFTPVSSNIAVYGWGVVAESPESAHLPLIDDTICGSLPVRALNFGQGAVWPRALPVHLRAALWAARADAVAGAAAPQGQFIQKGGKSETLAGIWKPSGNERCHVLGVMHCVLIVFSPSLHRRL